MRLTRQAVVEGTVVDENNVGLPSTLVQLFQYRALNGWRRLMGGASDHTDEMGGFRISGLSPGRYYLGATARFERLRNPKKLVYAPSLYPDATDISAAQPIDLQPGSDEHIKVRLRAVVSHQVRGQVAGRPSKRFAGRTRPRSISFVCSRVFGLGRENRPFTIRDAPPGTYVLEAWTGLDGRHLRAARTITVADSDLDGILIESRAMPEVTGRVLLDGKALSPGVGSHVTLQSPQRTAGARIEDDGSFRVTNVEPGTYRVFVPNAASSYVQSIHQGTRDVLRDGITIEDSEADPIEIQLRSQAATIEGVGVAPGPDHQAAVIVGLFRQVDEELVLEKQAAVGGFVMSFNGNPPVVLPMDR